MMQHPSLALVLGQQRHAAFIGEAERDRLARAARHGGRSAKPPAPRRLFRIPATRSRLARLRPARAR